MRTLYSASEEKAAEVFLFWFWFFIFKQKFLSDSGQE